MPLILACATSSFGRHGPRAACVHVPALGLAHLELPIHTAGLPTPFGEEPLLTEAATEADVQDVRRLLDRHGLQLSCCTITSGNPLDPEVLGLLHHKLEVAARLGVRLVVGDAGAAVTADERAQLLRHVRELGDHAAQSGLVYACETLPGVCQNHRLMLEFMRDLQHPHVALSFDPGQLLFYNEQVIVEVALARICPLVRHVRLRDGYGSTGEWASPALGYGGGVDFLRIYQILRDVAYAGPCCLAVDSLPGETDLPVSVHVQRLRDSLRTLRDCGFPVPAEADPALAQDPLRPS